MRTNFALLVGALLLTSSLPRVVAQTKADGAETDTSFTLVVELDGAYNKGFTLCTLIRPSQPFNVEWMQGGLKSSISGSLRQPEGEVYPLTLTVKQGLTDSQVGTSLTSEHKLKLGTADRFGGILSSVHVENEQVVLRKGSCPNKTDQQTK
ncbi:MAG TPA: hypothetical protein VN310_03555 [Candidatus Dormibacteraeota bacterium]|jgi:hypothetical protein|nr:hypothetical protein [Candidatus Dormibacteraeota bacterium]